MNWLAHAFLSKREGEFRLGNLLADLVKGRDRAGMSAGFLEGVRMHWRIDAFADWHPVVHRSRARIGDGFPHARGILVDVFYDHFLAVEWERYAREPLDAFTARLYEEMRGYESSLPEQIRPFAEGMVRDDLLGSYRRVEGIEAALRRLSLRLLSRTGRDLGLERGVGVLVSDFERLRGDFVEFFPQLQGHLL
jgi:acyl carrier protein phosphodiesterase